jgi:hypothetical protein
MVKLLVKPIGTLKFSFGVKAKKIQLTLGISGQDLRRNLQQLYSLDKNADFFFTSSRPSEEEGSIASGTDSDEDDIQLQFTCEAVSEYCLRRAEGKTVEGDEDLDARWKPSTNGQNKAVLSLYVEGTNLTESAKVNGTRNTVFYS